MHNKIHDQKEKKKGMKREYKIKRGIYKIIHFLECYVVVFFLCERERERQRGKRRAEVTSVTAVDPRGKRSDVDKGGMEGKAGGVGGGPERGGGDNDLAGGR
ncbi:hypothetical protein SK128_018266 [Halocaridina rubra]|uniref:Uncharacterized protein n=1 Tax=Halocaridina rubra TaxID=373956 RepID=A0AAN8WC42_HALRR